MTRGIELNSPHSRQSFFGCGRERICSGDHHAKPRDSYWSDCRENGVQCWLVEQNVLLEGATVGGLKATETAYSVSEV
jgi:hypothetical protein